MTALTLFGTVSGKNAIDIIKATIKAEDTGNYGIGINIAGSTIDASTNSIIV